MSGHRTRVIQLQDLLRITPEEATEILGRLGEETKESVGQDRRASPRYSYQHVPRLVVCVQDDEHGLENYFVMVPRNISRTGIGLLHGQFVYPQTKSIVHLKTLDGRLVGIKGQIVHCRMVEGRIHELGVEFATPIDLAGILGHGRPG